MSKYCDGVIVGSAIVRQVGEYGGEAAPERSAHLSRACETGWMRKRHRFFQKKD